MGLDMYLFADLFVGGNYEHRKVEGIVCIDSEGKPLLHTEDMSSLSSIRFSVGHWRKAYELHRWFVDNVQNGEDNCAYYYVSHTELEDLLEVCKKNPWQWDEYTIKETIKILSEVLRDDSPYKHCEFYYRSSW